LAAPLANGWVYRELRPKDTTLKTGLESIATSIESKEKYRVAQKLYIIQHIISLERLKIK